MLIQNPLNLSWNIQSERLEYHQLDIKEFHKGIDFSPQTQIFWSQYLCNLMVQNFDISNLAYFIFKY